MSPHETQQALIKLASSYSLRHAGEASGRCFVASLEFAHQAGKISDLSLLRWRVRHDPEFSEHWAVRLSPTQALDVTRVQVDGEVAVVKNIASYPAGYFLAGEYPASMLLKCFAPSVTSGRVPLGLALSTRWFMYLHDVNRASVASKWKSIILGLDSLEYYLLSVLTRKLLRRLKSRRAHLLRKLRKSPDGPSGT